MKTQQHITFYRPQALIINAICLLFLFGCNQSSSNNEDIPVTATRYAHECVALSTGAVPITIKNKCDFNIVFRELPDQPPITIIIDMEEQYTPENDVFNFGVCKAPYSPAILENNQYDCR